MQFGSMNCARNMKFLFPKKVFLHYKASARDLEGMLNVSLEKECLAWVRFFGLSLIFSFHLQKLWVFRIKNAILIFTKVMQIKYAEGSENVLIFSSGYIKNKNI